MGGTLGASVAEEVVDVAIIGNGPSGLALAAALSGLVPEVLRNPPLSRDPAVNAAARRLAGRALDEAALFGEDIQRRCVNPSAALVDALRFPGGDGVGDSLLRYGQLKPLLRHAVVGRGPPGGSWQSMSPSTVTLSPGSWMDLPGHSLDEHLRTNASDEAKKLLRYYGSAQALSNARVPRWLVAEYYGSYARNLSATAFHSGTVEAMEEEGDCWRLQISGEEGCYALKARAVALACGSFATPRRLEIFGEELPFVTHRPPIHTPALMEKIGHLLVVGAGLSAADAILHVLTGPGAAAGAAGRKVQVTHVFRGAAQQTKIGKMFGGSTSSTYRDEEWLARLMARKDSDPRYRPLAEAQLLEITEEGTCRVQTPTGEETLAEVSVVALLLGALPDLGFLPRRLRRALKAAPHAAVTRTDGQISSHPQFLEVNQETLQLADADTKEVLAPNVFAAGPLRGDNFVRFLIGDAFVIRQQVAASAKLARESA